jgi:anhydro-N-acetylmuramic acid kinase
MVYKAIGIMSGSSLDGLDIAYVHIQETGGKWSYEIQNAAIYSYTAEWSNALKNAGKLSALDLQIFHTKYGRFVGDQINQFIDDFSLHHKVDLIASHGHTVFHAPQSMMTFQVGDGASIAAVTELPVVSDLRSLDVALGGQGAPIVPIGEKLLLSGYNFFLNLGGIANISFNNPDKYIAFDVCPANAVLNAFAKKEGKAYDDDGALAAKGRMNERILNQLSELDYYSLSYPKSLSNDFGTDVIYPMINSHGLSTEDALATAVEHIALQTKKAAQQILNDFSLAGNQYRLLVSGGGALNVFLVSRLREHLGGLNITVEMPDRTLVEFKEAIIMALIGILRWREEYNVIASVTGAKRNSVGGALWLGAS